MKCYIYIYSQNLMIFFQKNESIMTKYSILIFCTLTKKLHNKIMHKSHNIILLSPYHSFMILTSHGSLQLREPKNESHVRKWVQQQWCDVQEQYNCWKQQGNDYEMKERKNFKCSYELLSCFKCFMNCLPFSKRKEWRESFSLVPFGPFFLKKDIYNVWRFCLHLKSLIKFRRQSQLGKKCSLVQIREVLSSTLLEWSFYVEMEVMHHNIPAVTKVQAKEEDSNVFYGKTKYNLLVDYNLHRNVRYLCVLWHHNHCYLRLGLWPHSRYALWW